MSFVDASYFIAELGIPNTDQAAVAQRVTWFINKYEPEFLLKLFGYPLYKAFVTGMNVTPPATPEQRFLDILYGKEYMDYQGRLQKWKGLIVTTSPVFNLSGGLAYRKPLYISAGVTEGFPSGGNLWTIPDWIGWTPVITRERILKPGVDYSWNVDPDNPGQLILLAPGDKFGNGEDFFVAFELRTDGAVPVIDLSANESCIANYVYYQFRNAGATQYTGIGEVLTQAENAVNVNPRRKIANIWNQMGEWVNEFCEFMVAMQTADPTAYSEWSSIDEYNALKTFGYMNPIF
jgi:hypothetical protein